MLAIFAVIRQRKAVSSNNETSKSYGSQGKSNPVDKINSNNTEPRHFPKKPLKNVTHNQDVDVPIDTQNRFDSLANSEWINSNQPIQEQAATKIEKRED